MGEAEEKVVEKGIAVAAALAWKKAPRPWKTFLGSSGW